MENSDLISPAELGEWLGKSTASLANWRYLGLGPKFVKLGPKAIRYRKSDVETWLEENTRTQT